MTLKGLIEKYDGTITVDVYRAIDGGLEEVVTFSNEDIGAIKDTVLNSDVAKYSIDTTVSTRAASIKVILVAVHDTTDSTEDTEANG